MRSPLMAVTGGFHTVLSPAAFPVNVLKGFFHSPVMGVPEKGETQRPEMTWAVCSLGWFAAICDSPPSSYSCL